MLKMSATQL